jgi:1-aminocyclopropane-1-carboxylate deaminase/D-cysteine desulfhydrase-like pyridoxal-dependent ACC family enzyme
MNSIFKEFSLDRKVIKWEDHLRALTPVENHNGLWFKREDKFAPLGYGGPNGSKLRQLIYYMTRNAKGKTHVLTGASIQSPQLSMSAIVGAHLGLPSRMVVYSKPDTVLRHDNPRIAYGFGTHFEYANAPYNPVLQRMVGDLERADSLVVQYGITVDHVKHPEELMGFHDVGANQTRNIPDEVKTLIVPAGSCNSLCSILLGLSRDAHNIETLFTVGIGPSKGQWIRERAEIMGINLDALPFKWKHFSLHDTGFSKYTDKFKGEQFDGINFHPTYEAKVWRYLKNSSDVPLDDSALFWIIGSEPKLKVIEPYFTHKFNNQPS